MTTDEGKSGYTDTIGQNKLKKKSFVNNLELIEQSQKHDLDVHSDPKKLYGMLGSNHEQVKS